MSAGKQEDQTFQQEQTYNIKVRGKVQQVGFRITIRRLGRKLDLPGFIFNGSESDVYVLTRASQPDIENFIQEIKEASKTSDADIEGEPIIEEVEGEPVLPSSISIVETDDREEFNERLAKAYSILRNIKTDTENIEDIKDNTEDIEEIKNNTSQMVQILDNRLPDNSAD